MEARIAMGAGYGGTRRKRMPARRMPVRKHHMEAGYGVKGMRKGVHRKRHVAAGYGVKGMRKGVHHRSGGASDWVHFVKKVQRDNGCSYKEAMEIASPLWRNL